MNKNDKKPHSKDPRHHLQDEFSKWGVRPTRNKCLLECLNSYHIIDRTNLAYLIPFGRYIRLSALKIILECIN